MVAIRVRFGYHRNNYYGNKKLQKDAEEIEMGALPQRLEREKYGQYP